MNAEKLDSSWFRTRLNFGMVYEFFVFAVLSYGEFKYSFCFPVGHKLLFRTKAHYNS